MNCTFTIPWADGSYSFALDRTRLMELQQKCEAGPIEILRRLSFGAARVADWREPIRLALIGGGVEPLEAQRLVADYVDARPAAEAIELARLILIAPLFGVDERLSAGEVQGAPA